jgi:replicative DNA helicase
MSLYSKLVAASIASGSVSSLMVDFKEAYLLEDERPLFEFVRAHQQRYGHLPSSRTVANAGFNLGNFEESPLYYNDRLRQRFAYNVINERHPAFREALEARNMPVAVERLREMLVEVGTTTGEDTATTLVSEVVNVLDEFDRRKLRSGLAGITFGWPTLDELTLGAMGGDVIVIAGRPSMGKSWLLFESAFQAWRAGNSIAIISMEMGKVQVVRRWMGRHLGINPNFIRSGQVSAWTEEMLRGYADTASAMPRVSLISGDMEKQIDGIEATIREHLPDIIYIDAAYLLTPSGQSKGYISKWEMISKVIGQLKKLAVKYNRPIFITVQFNRNQRNDSQKEPDLGDISGSDSIPQDASIICGVRLGLPPFESIRRRLLVMKNREGEGGEFTTDFRFTPPSMVEIADGADALVQTSWMI